MYRTRRLRKTAALRQLVRENQINKQNLVMPYFVVEGKNRKNPISSMPGIFQLSIDNLLKKAQEIYSLGISSILLFGLPQEKNKGATASYDESGLVQRAVKALKKEIPDLVIITDVCLCSYTLDGHCEVRNNDETLKILAKAAVTHANAGADIVAPSAMMDGQVKAIREALDKKGFTDTAIMSYSAKYASSFYGPFREAACSSPKHGDRKTYQMDYSNAREALREMEIDLSEGADILMVKPALAYLDIISRAKEKFNLPIAAYNVSGEYSMLMAAGKNGWIDREKAVMEVLASIKRAGADIIITYHAKEIAKII